MDRVQEKWAVGLASVTAALLGAIPEMVWLLLFAQTVDMATGMLVAYNNSKLSSTVARKGITKKIAMMLLVMIAYGLEHALGVKVPIGTAAAGYYAAMEIISCTENAALLGIPIAPSIKNGLEILKHKSEDEDKGEGGEKDDE